MYQIANLQFEELIRNRNSIFVSLICKDSYWNLISDLFRRSRQNSSNQKIIFLKNRSSHQRCSLQNGVLRNFTKLTGKHLCQGLFFFHFFKKENLAHCFAVNFVKFLRTPFLQNTSGRLLLEQKKGSIELFKNIYYMHHENH